MTNGMEQAVRKLQPEVGRKVTWFVPAEKKFLVSPEAIHALTHILLLAFLAGVQEEARKLVKSAGKKSLKWLEGAILALFRGTVDAAPDDAAIKALAEEAPATVQTLPAVDFEFCVRRTREELTVYLKARLPEAEATSLALKVEQAAVDSVLKRNFPR